MLVKPFGGLEAKSTEVERMNCPPYDVVDLEEAKKFSADTHSFMRIVRPDSIAKAGEDIYEIAAKELNRFIDEKLFIKNEKPSFYIYSQKMLSHVQTGLVACVPASAYPEHIKRHELTRKEKEDERMKHILATHAHTEHVFLMYKSQKEIKKLMRIDLGKHLYNFKTENPDTIHNLYRVEDSALIQDITHAFQNVDAFYIADGHHRASASVRVAAEMGGSGEWNYFMATIFPHDELQILGYHRIVKSIDGSESDFLRKIKDAGFDVKKTYNKPPELSKHTIGMYMEGEWYSLRAMDVDDSDLINALDVSILQERILDNILGIKDPRTDSKLDFVGGVNGFEDLKKAVDAKEYKVAFYMHPTEVGSVIEVADKNMIMPPKSTWFEPKLRSGFLVHTF
jgi:uncharacterized protein (DUF1015 family)